MIWLTALAWATQAFDPTTPDRVFSGLETFSTDGEFALWGAIERHVDANDDLFGPIQFNETLDWDEGDAYAPYIHECFETGRPASGAFLLHLGLGIQASAGTPVLFVHGAGDNASRGMITMAFRFVSLGRPVYAITFPHPHQDVFQQAEIVADAVARITARHGGGQVDVVSHSKGGIATAVYLSHTPGADWGDAAYEAHGTPYRGDVRRAVFVATPLDGLDTSYRWPGINYASLDAETAASPSSWEEYYPLGVAVPLSKEDLSRQDFFPGGGDLFPGHRQLLKKQDAALPGELPWLGVYSLSQQDWFTTWNGGYGFYSYSRGIDAAIEAGGGLIERLAAQGVDPDVELFLVAGKNPLLTNGTMLIAEAMYTGIWGDLAFDSVDAWTAFTAQLVRQTFPGLKLDDGDLQGLSSGRLIMGEITAKSDGLVMVSSATHAEALTARGARVVETYVADLAHLDLMYASTITADLMEQQIAADPVEYGWTTGLADRYRKGDTIGWVDRVLRDDDAVDPPDTDAAADTDDSGAAADTDAPGDTDAADPELPGVRVGCECGHAGAVGWGWLAVGALAAARRRQRPRYR